MREQRSLTGEGGGVGGQRWCVTCGVSKRLRVMCGEGSGRSIWMRTENGEEGIGADGDVAAVRERRRRRPMTRGRVVGDGMKVSVR